MRRLTRAARRAAVRTWLSTGDSVECPCCGRSLRSFLAHGAFNRPNVACPEWNVDIQALPFPDESSDAFLCSHVLEHVEDDRRAMDGLLRVLRPGGWGIVMVPQHWGLAETLEDPLVVTPQERLETYGQADHLRLYGRDFVDRLRGAGFEGDVEGYAAQLPAELRERYALGLDSIFLCRRV